MIRIATEADATAIRGLYNLTAPLLHAVTPVPRDLDHAGMTQLLKGAVVRIADAEGWLATIPHRIDLDGKLIEDAEEASLVIVRPGQFDATLAALYADWFEDCQTRGVSLCWGRGPSPGLPLMDAFMARMGVAAGVVPDRQREPGWVYWLMTPEQGLRGVR